MLIESFSPGATSMVGSLATIPIRSLVVSTATQCVPSIGSVSVVVIEGPTRGSQVRQPGRGVVASDGCSKPGFARRLTGCEGAAPARSEPEYKATAKNK